MLKTVAIAILITVAVLIEGCHTKPFCHLNATDLYIKRDPCREGPPTREESRRRKSAHRL